MRNFVKSLEEYDDDEYEEEQVSPQSSFGGGGASMPYDDLISNRPGQSAADMYLRRAAGESPATGGQNVGMDNPMRQNNPVAEQFPAATMGEEKNSRLAAAGRSSGLSSSGGGMLSRKRNKDDDLKHKKKKRLKRLRSR